MRYLKILTVCLFITILSGCSESRNVVEKNVIEDIAVVQEDKSNDIFIYLFTSDKVILQNNDKLILDLKEKYKKKYPENNIEVIITKDKDYLNIKN